MGCARAAPIPDEVLSAPIEPSAVRVMGLLVPVTVQMVLDTVTSHLIDVQVVALWHAARFQDPRSLVLALTSLVDEALRAVSGSLIALSLLF